MSTSFNRASLPFLPRAPITSFQYREMAALPPIDRMRNPPPSQTPDPAPTAEVQMSRAELQAMLAEARTQAAAEVLQNMAEQQSQRIEQESARISGAIERFERESKGYYARVETEVVRLALSIAAKILHREAQVEPMLVAALVQIAVNQLKENTAVNVRVHPEDAGRWRAHFQATPQWAAVTVIEDAELERGDCYLETELGSANFSLAAQLKEVEQGFFDILAQAPRG